MRVARTLPSIALIVVGLFLISGLTGNVAAYTPKTIEPAPFLEGNATFSTHLSSYGPLEYASGSGTGNLSVAAVDSRVANPYQINESGIVAPGLQNDKVAGSAWNVTGAWTPVATFTPVGSINTASTGTANGKTDIRLTVNSSLAGHDVMYWETSMSAPPSTWPSANILFDYVTGIVGFSGTGPCGTSGKCQVVPLIGGSGSSAGDGGSVGYNTSTSQVSTCGSAFTITGWLGCYSQSTVQNAYGYGAPAANETCLCLQPSTFAYFSVPLAALSTTSYNGWSTGFMNTSGSQLATNLSIEFEIYLAQAVTTTYSYTATVYGLALTTTPFWFGVHTGTSGKAKGVHYNPSVSSGPILLSSFTPGFPYTSINGGTFTVAIQAQAGLASGVIINQAPNSNGSEQVTYSIPLTLPSASGLAYGTFKLVDIPTLQGWQYVSVQFAGTVYTGVYQTKSNAGNFTTVAASVNPTTGGTWLGVVVYTQSQWESVSSPPGFFTVGGLQYTWYVLIITIAGALGLGSAWAVRKSDSFRVR